VHQPIPPIRLDLLELFDEAELSKYLTAAELEPLHPGSPGPAADGGEH
jgi:hypothetical protein